ncbi:MAG: hypothetical protein WBM17_10750 [Anaerolineales bacterium]
MQGLKASRSDRKSLAFFLPLMLVMGFALSCSIFGSDATPITPATATAQPADTIAPADTVEPADTEEPEPTKKATANKAATRQAQEEETATAEAEAAGAVLGEIETKLDDVGEIMGNGSVVWYYPSPIEVDSSKPNTIYYQLVDSSIRAADFALHTNIKWETKQKIGIVNCIIMFRMGSDINMDNWYMMRMGRISGLPHIWFQLFQGWNFITESPGSASNYIRDEGGAENEVILVANKNQFTAYVNGHQVEVWWNAKQDSGGFGLGTWQDTGSSVCTFSDNWVWEWS